MSRNGMIWRAVAREEEGTETTVQEASGRPAKKEDSLKLLASVFRSRSLRANYNGAPSAARGPRPPLDFGIAIADLADEALGDIRKMSISRISNGEESLCVGTLILLLPDLAWDSFGKPEGDKHYGREALVLNAVGRIVVLVCPRDLGLCTTNYPKVMGRDGSKPGAHEKVEVIDITALLDIPTQARGSALRSCEVIGLMARLAQGMTVQAAIGGGSARLVLKTEEKDKA